MPSLSSHDRHRYIESLELDLGGLQSIGGALLGHRAMAAVPRSDDGRGASVVGRAIQVDSNQINAQQKARFHSFRARSSRG